MIAAVYACKSTDQNLPDAEKSVTRQVEHARTHALRKGWTFTKEHVYADDGISGAEFLKPPGFLHLMNALKPRPPFQVLVMPEESRLRPHVRLCACRCAHDHPPNSQNVPTKPKGAKKNPLASWPLTKGRAIAARLMRPLLCP